jgi:hypothetical protein
VRCNFHFYITNLHLRDGFFFCKMFVSLMKFYKRYIQLVISFDWIYFFMYSFGWKSEELPFHFQTKRDSTIIERAYRLGMDKSDCVKYSITIIKKEYLYLLQVQGEANNPNRYKLNKIVTQTRWAPVHFLYLNQNHQNQNQNHQNKNI